MPRPKPNHTGKRFGRLVAIQEGDRKPSTGGYGYQTWICQCNCGEVVTVVTSNLVQGLTRSCGCLKREDAIRLGNDRRVHGMSNTLTYKTWATMLARCGNPNESAYPKYGGRGISVCARWQESFTAFLEDMGERPSPRHSIERKDNGGNYTPLNCKWATPTEQARNKRNTRFVTFRGQKMALVEAVERYAVAKLPTVKARLDRHGWTLERALATPPRTVSAS